MFCHILFHPSHLVPPPPLCPHSCIKQATNPLLCSLLTWSNQNATTSTLSTPVGGLTTSGHTLSYDWSYLVSSTGRGPPNVQCTLKTTLYNGFTIQSWTRRAATGGKGRVSETFDANASGGTVAINFECAGNAGSAVVNAGVAIDNVEYTGTVA
jgi:hypothetical protein